MKYQFSTRPLPFVLSLALLALVSELRGEVGGDNPTGVAGIFNGNVTTGCSYDPYTGNATRTVTDISVAGAVGEYGLSLSRTFSSRNGWGHDFGMAGAWHHNYNWDVEDSATSTTSGFQPGSYTVDFPDGRSETFVYSAADPGYYRTTAGVQDRFVPLNRNTMLAYLVLPDGGKIEFKATQQSYRDDCCPQDGCGLCTFYYYTYVPQAIIDPHGLRTSLTYNVDGTLYRVTEPAGRYIQFHWMQVSGYKVIDYITASDGRSVHYYYATISPGGTAYTALDHVIYFGNGAWTAYYQYQAPNVPPAYGLPLLRTADDPMYSGPMKRIAYTYKTGTNPDNSAAVFGQIQSENYYDGTNIGLAVSTLTVTGANTRKETRYDGTYRTFSYQTGGYLSSSTDFDGISASQTYDVKKYINSVTDRNGHTTNFTRDALTGMVTQIQYPLTTIDTPGQSQRPTVNYTYTNDYYLHTAQDEGGHTTTYTRNANNRVTRIDYPDGGYETFGYDASHFYQLSSRRITAGGTETFAYDGRHRLQYYSDAYHNNTNNPSMTYYYDGLDRVSGVVDALNHSTNYDYNDRGQLTVTTLPWYNGTRYTITNVYNTDGTLRSRTDELGHVTSYTYDDYRRLKSVTPPARGDGTGTHTTSFYYGANAWDGVADYKFTDSNVTWVVLPSGKKTSTVYDDNRRKQSVTVGYGTVDAATTSYTYDNVGNVRMVTNPLSHSNVSTLYDQRNRPYQISVGPSQTTTISYDTAGHKKEVDRPNGQVITYDSFDPMNRVLQQSASNTRLGGTQYIRTKYTYTQAGLIDTFQDPHLFGGSDQFNYGYDLMGRKTSLTYPLDDNNVHHTEQWSYDTAGRLYQFTNRAGKVQTFSYDQLSRVSQFTWSDTTPGVSFDYDAASNLVEIDNASAAISRLYWNDNLLRSETETATGGIARTASYTYDEDGNRATLQYPGYSFSYDYTNRNQVKAVMSGATAWARYEYDLRGNITSRTVNTSPSTSSAYTYDVYDRVTLLHHYLSGTTRTIQYGYDAPSNNRLWALRTMSPTSAEDHKGEVFSYDLNDQVTAMQLDVANPDQVQQPLDQTVAYDPNGNRQFFPGRQYAAANNLSQYTSVTESGTQYDLTYGANGNLSHHDKESATYGYDAQNRLTSATVGGVAMTFKYDGLNRQVSRTVGGTTTYNIWDGWHLVEEYLSGGSTSAVYLNGPGGVIIGAQVTTGQFNYYYQDGSGSTSHIADSSGQLEEWYRYDLQGTPFFYDANNNQLSASNYSVRHLFVGQQWYKEIGLYDLRNRFYSPDIGRFLQPDPIGFWGDRSNLYRYCANNAVTRRDPFGLTDQNTRVEGNDVPSGGEFYSGSENPNPDLPDTYGWGGEPDPNDPNSVTPVGVTPAYPGDHDDGDPVGVPGGVPGGFPGGSGGPGGFPGGGEPGVGPGGHGSGGPGGHHGRGPGGLPGGRPGGQPNGTPGGSPNSGLGNPWLPSWPTLPDPFPYLGPPTPEDVAWTNSGFWPTVIFGTAVGAPEILDAIGIDLLRDNLHFDGPSVGFRGFRSGRIAQIRFGDYPLVRLDYKPIPSSRGLPQLHLNFGNTDAHVPIAPAGWPW
jgi:RHS repeat-associated protein